MSTDLPSMTSHSYATSVYSPKHRVQGAAYWAEAVVGGYLDPIATAREPHPYEKRKFKSKAAAEREENMSTPKTKLRVVRVFLVDTDDRVPVEKRMLHSSNEMTTDATDEELFFQIPVQQILEDHNKARADLSWEETTESGTKSRKGLKPLRIRDLSMQVTVIASF